MGEELRPLSDQGSSGIRFQAGAGLVTYWVNIGTGRRERDVGLPAQGHLYLERSVTRCVPFCSEWSETRLHDAKLRAGIASLPGVSFWVLLSYL